MSIFREAVDINYNNPKKVSLGSYFWILNSKFELSTQLVFSFSDTLRDKYYMNKSEMYLTYGLTEYI